MTRHEFFKRRAVMAFERERGVTQCPPGEADALPAITVRARQYKPHILGGAGQRMTGHPRDESGAVVPIRARSQK